MLEAAQQEAAHAVPEPMEEGDSQAEPDRDQQVVEDAQQQQPAVMQEDMAKPDVHSARLQGDAQGPGQGTPKALASTLVSHTLTSADTLMLVQSVVQPRIYVTARV